MESIVAKVLEKLKVNFEKIFNGNEIKLSALEEQAVKLVSEATLDVVAAYYEWLDMKLINNKKKRKEKNLVIERKHQKREIFTRIGQLTYNRTYYSQTNKKTNKTKYLFPIDQEAGIESYQRVSEGTGYQLVNNACQVSYHKSSQIVTNGAISRQTVMNLIRRTSTVAMQEETELKKVPYLHIDADEDHIHLQTGKDSIVPLISVYEGITHIGTRGKCQNIFHIGTYGKKADELWEKAYTEIGKKYDLTNTQVYIHGDGASWIMEGMNWFAGAKFVLDPYHMNKALKQSVSNIPQKDGKMYVAKTRKYLYENDLANVDYIKEEMLQNYPSCEKTIVANMDYLMYHIRHISIRAKDMEARNGGATEPHISHVYSNRLSTRPKGWSKKTLVKFIPILSGSNYTFHLTDDENNKKKQYNIIARRSKSNCYADTNYIDRIASTFGGHTSASFNAIKGFLK